VLLISNDSLFSLSLNGNFRTSSRKIEWTEGFKALDIFSRSGEVFVLQPHQLVKQSLTDTIASTLSLSETGLNALPVNKCFLLSNAREIIVGTTMGLYIFYPDDFEVLPSYIDLRMVNTPILTLHQDTSQLLWFTSNTGLYTLNRLENQLKYYCSMDGLNPPESGYYLVAASSEGELAYAGEDQLIVFHPDSIREEITSPLVQLINVEVITRNGIENLALLDTDTLRLKSRFTMLRFYSSVIDYWNPELNTYQYSFCDIDKEDEWSDISGENIIQIPRLKAGNYRLKIRGANSKNVWSDEPDEIILHIAAPIWRSRLAFFVYIILVILTFYFSLFFTTRHLRRLNREYKEREQIAKKVEYQKEELTLKNKNITDSINYAKRIQMALMPSQRIFSRIFRDSFILHIPKDIVSGDFYWINQVDGRIYFAAVDCTGHGVPGAFMSIIGFELFRRITEIEKKKQPAEILNSLSQGFETIFRDIEDMTLRDGMDVAFCAIDPEMKVLEYAGAFNPLYLIRDNTISEIKGDRFSVGLNQADDGVTPQEFQDHIIKLKDQDIIYIFTDGYADQFGGPEGKKYKYRRFRHLLLALHQLPMERQLEFLRRSIMDWKGDLDQVDDILVMGIRISQKS
jgi:serine phosphatase RsbU (regulator of sigma subunit)